MTQPYKKPPIIESVIALSFAEQTEDRLLTKAADRLGRQYPKRQEQELTSFELAASGPSIRRERAGYRLSDNDEHFIVLISPGELVTSVLAPYPGFEELKSRAMENYSVFRDAVKYKPITRFGARYINRIDIPLRGKPGAETLDYITVAPFAPRADFLNNVGPYFLRFESQAPSGFKVIITTGSAQPPILDHISILLDIDVISSSPPQKESELSSLADEIRRVKNDVFETCITDRARELFNS